MGSIGEAWQPSRTPAERHRRSLYALKLRGHRDPFFEMFNVPNGESSCEARDVSTVTPQVFALFNSAHAFDRALAFARRATKEVVAEHGLKPDEYDRLLEIMGRTPTMTELGIFSVM